MYICGYIPAILSSGNAFVSGERGLRFKSLAGQIEHRVADGSLLLRHFFEAVSPGRNDAKMGPQIRNTLWRITVSSLREVI